MHKQDLNRVVKESMDLYGIFIIILVRPIYRLIMHFKEQCTIMNRLLFDFKSRSCGSKTRECLNRLG